MSEYCKHYRCVFDDDGHCSFFSSRCPLEAKAKRCVYSRLYRVCVFAFYDGDTLRCGFDTGGTQKKVPGLPQEKYLKKLAIDDLDKCIKEY